MPSKNTNVGISLHKAAENGYAAIIKFLVEEGLDVNAANQYGVTALHKAAYEGHTEIVKALLANGASVNAADQDGKTALHIAVEKGHLEIAEYLLSSGADHTINNSEGRTPIDYLLVKHEPQELLDLAIQKGFPKLAELSINAGARVNLINRNEQFTSPLSRAVENNNWAVVKVLVEKGANIGFSAAKDGNMVSMLHLAASTCNLEMMTFFIEQGLDVNETDFYGDTALHIVIKSSKSEEDKSAAMKLLLANEANISARGDEENTLLHIAIQNGQFHTILKELSEEQKKDLIDARNVRGDTPIIFAARAGKWEIVMFLAKNGADVKAENKIGYTVLMLAAHACEWEIVNLLIEKGVDVKVTNTEGYTTLHYAAQGGGIKTVELLLAKEKEVDVNIKNNDGYTPLHLAANNGYLNVVNALIAKKADVNAVDKDGHTALYWAAANDHLDVVNAIAKGADINALDAAAAEMASSNVKRPGTQMGKTQIVQEGASKCVIS